MRRLASSTTYAPGAAPPSADFGDLETPFRLSVADLQPGEGGEVVLFNDSAFRVIVLEAARGDYETGTTDVHVTAEGVDVTGFRFVRFADGLTVFHAPDTEVTILTR